MESGEDRTRPPLISLSAFAFLGSAMLWAEKQDWVDLAIFFDDFLKDWRDALRAIWGAIVANLQLPFVVLDHQKDALSLISFLIGGSLYRLAYSFKSVPLFYPTFDMLLRLARERYGAIGFFVVLLLSSTISIAMCVIILAPFFDTMKFTHDFYVWAIVGYSVAITYVFLTFTYAAIMFAWEKIHSEGFLSYLKYCLISVLTFILFMIRFIIFVAAISVVIVTLLSYVELGFMRVPIGIPLDPEPFHLESYVRTLNAEKYIDLALVAAAFLLLAITAGRSLRPLAQFLLIGGLVVLVGWLAGVMMEAFPQQFPPTPITQTP